VDLAGNEEIEIPPQIPFHILAQRESLPPFVVCLPQFRISFKTESLALLQVECRIHDAFELLCSIDTSPKILTIESIKILALRAGLNLLSANILISRTSMGSQLQQQYK
jgi:hypothetical protein